MTVPTTTNKVIATGNGVATVFPFAFGTLPSGNLVVTLIDLDGIEHLQVENTDYTVQGEGDEDGGSVTFAVAPADLWTVLIQRILPETQPTDLKNQGSFFPRTIERMLDRVTMLIQQLSERIGSALTLPPWVTGVSTVLPEPEANKLIGWNETPNGLRNVSLSELATTLAFSNFKFERFTATTGQAMFELESDPGALANLDVSVDGVAQVAMDDYTLTGRFLNFTTPLTDGQRVFVRYGTALPPAVGLTYVTYPAIATAGQTVFDLPQSYVGGAGAMSVYADGLRLRAGVDYTETSPTRVTLTTPALDGQEFTFVFSESVSTAYAPASAVQFLQDGTGAVPRTMQDKGREVVTPEDFGAVGDGVANDAAALVAAGANVSIPTGKTFRVSTDITIGQVYANGGQITVDAGVTLTVNGVTGDDASVIFNGLGTVRTASDHYSVGWYAGTSINAKWDFLRRALVTNVPYTCVFPRPSENDPAASNGGGSTVWKLTAPLKFNDPENMGHILMYSPIFAAAAMGQMLLFSDVEKTENIWFPFGLELDGGNNAVHGIEIRGGARLQWEGYVAVVRCTGNGVHINTTAFPTDEVTFDFLNVTDLGNVGLWCEGATSGTLNLGTRVNYLFCNGMKATGKSMLVVRGLVRNFTCENIMENAQTGGGGLFDFTECAVRFEATTAGSPRYKTNYIGTIHCNISAVPSFIASDASGGTAAKMGVSINSIRNNNAAGAIVQLAWMDSGSFRDIDGGAATLVTIASNCSDLNFTNIRPEQMTGVIDRLRVGGSLVAYNPTLADDTAMSLAFPAATLGFVDVSCADTNAWAVFFCKDGATAHVVAAGSSANVIAASTVLTGTTSTDGKLNIAASPNRVYVENRLGGAQRTKVNIRL